MANGFPALLAILLIGLKLTGVIAWSWWFVLMPLWIGFAIIMAFIAIWFVIAAIARV